MDSSWDSESDYEWIYHIVAGFDPAVNAYNGNPFDSDEDLVQAVQQYEQSFSQVINNTLHLIEVYFCYSKANYS